MSLVLPDNLDQLYIGGEWAKPLEGDVLTVFNPSTEELIAEVSCAAQADVDAAVAAARHAFDHGPWPRMPVEERILVLERLARALAREKDNGAELVTAELGAPISQSRSVQAAWPVGIAAAHLDIARAYPFAEERTTSATRALVTREPVGVVGAIIPWNAPLASATLKLVSALVTGCTVVLKPAPETPLSAYFIAHLLDEIGLPPGVVSIVPGGAEIGQHLVSHPGVDKVTFTGSTAAGRHIASVCGEQLKRVTLELGGKSAAIVLDDADLDSVMDSLRAGSLRNSGQICSLKTRVVVPQRLESEIVERLAAMVQSMPVGDPADPTTEIGPLVSERQMERVEEYRRIGEAEGATPVVRGGRPDAMGRGWFVAPTLFADVQSKMRIAQEEIFGPVLSVISYADDAEAVQIANDSTYGLSGAVFGSDIDRAMKVARGIRTGTVEVNGNPAGFVAPMGGFKCSGLGREYGPEGLDAFVEFKSFRLPPQGSGD